MNKIIFLALSLSFIIADINISGDARIRPRLDIKDSGGDYGASSTDLYYLYRARLNINADIGDGWFFKSKIGTNDVASIVKLGVEGTFADATGSSSSAGNSNSARPRLSFLNLYYGFKKDNFGFWGGAIPISHNSALDIHFYPNKIVDVPFLLWNNASTTGFAGYVYKLNWFISIDDNNTEIDETYTTDDEITYTKVTAKSIDPFTIGMDFPMKWNNYLDIHARGLFSVTDKAEPGPMTFGVDMKITEIFKVKPPYSYYYSTQFIGEDNKYDITHLRAKLKFMNLTFWTDMAQHIDKSANIPETTDLTYIWIDYNHKLFSGDMGSISIKPTIRYQMGKVGNPDYSRMKLELTTGIKFK